MRAHARRDDAVPAAARDSRPAQPRAAARRQRGVRWAQAAIQAKLNVGPVDDPHEREADRISRLAMGPAAQRAPEPIRHVQAPTSGAADPGVARAVDQARGGGRAVPGGVRERMERVSGADLSGVRVHVGAESDRLNEALGSRAFTVGADVFVRRSEYRPGSARGDALLAHELTHTVQQGAAGPCAAGAGALAQRKFGFELELHQVPLFSRRGDVEGRPESAAGIVARGTRFEAHVDHSLELDTVVPATVRGGADYPSPILELVTGPMDEFKDSENTVRTVMNRLVRVARDIENRALTPSRSIPLDGVAGLTASRAGVNFVGYPTATTAPPGTLTGGDASVQATFGLSLSRVGEEFEAVAAQTPSPATAQNKYGTYRTAVGVAKNRADEVVQWVRTTYPGTYGDAALAEAHGLFALIAYYLVVGKIADWTNLNKNHAGIFFYKTRLSTVRNQLVRSHPTLEGLLSGDNQFDLAYELLVRTGRDSGDPVFPRTHENVLGVKLPVMCGEWLDGVLSGTADKVYDVSATQGPPELLAPRVGRGAARGPGVVVENRRFAQTKGLAYSHAYPPDQWVGLAVQLRRDLRARQGYAPGERGYLGRLVSEPFLS